MNGFLELTTFEASSSSGSTLAFLFEFELKISLSSFSLVSTSEKGRFLDANGFFVDGLDALPF